MVEHIWASALPPFNENAACPKCRSADVKVIYHRTDTEGFECHSDFAWVIDEHLCRVCARCGYGWCEAVATGKPDLRAVPDASSKDGDHA